MPVLFAKNRSFVTFPCGKMQETGSYRGMVNTWPAPRKLKAAGRSVIGRPPDRMSAKPRAVENVARVAMKGGRPAFATITPFRLPIAMPIATPAKMPGHSPLCVPKTSSGDDFWFRRQDSLISRQKFPALPK